MEGKLKDKTLCVIGLGLIGGSLALESKNKNLFKNIIGVDNNESHVEEALELKLIDEVIPFDEAIAKADIIALAIPVTAIIKVLPRILDKIQNNQVVFDLGSTKESILKIADNHPNGNRFIPAHPMAGTEYSGPQAAKTGLYEGKVCIICESKKQDESARMIVESLFEKLDMQLVTMNAEAHDTHVAYVSHISHITSFVLATTVLEKEKSTKAIFDLASGGFRSTVRLAKSPPTMWLPIFKENKDNILEVLDTYLEQMQSFREMINNDDEEGLLEKMKQGNEIRKILG